MFTETPTPAIPTSLLPKKTNVEQNHYDLSYSIKRHDFDSAVSALADNNNNNLSELETKDVKIKRPKRRLALSDEFNEDQLQSISDSVIHSDSSLESAIYKFKQEKNDKIQ